VQELENIEEPPKKHPSARGHRRVLIAVAALGLATIGAAIYVIPYRLLNDTGNSFYTFGYVGDEYLYAQRLQPLIPGTTRANVINGIGDPGVWSQFYLEDLCRAILDLSGLDVVTFMWLWRLVFPVVLFLSFYCLVAVTLPRPHRFWTMPFRLAAVGASVALLHGLYDMVTQFPPLQGWIQRIPTNIEFPLALLMAAASVALIVRPTPWRAALLGICGVAMIYLRLYTAIPWGLATAVFLLFVGLSRQVPWKLIALAAIVVAVGLIPWLLIQRYNSSFDVYQQMFKRYFVDVEYRAHPYWDRHLGFAVVLGLLAWLTPGWRALIGAWAVTLPILAFGTGLLPIRAELLWFDRYGVFYLIATITAGLLCLRTHAETWKGWRGFQRGSFASYSLSGVALAGALFTAWNNVSYDFDKYPLGPLPFIRLDLRHVPAYVWMAKNTPADALVLVDDGSDWAAVREKGEEYMARYWERWWKTRDDLFQIVACRRSVYTNRMHQVAISDELLTDAGVIFLGTFGLNQDTPAEAYAKALRNITPDYIFWKKTAPVPRGYGRALKPFCDVVHFDEHCEIWRVNKELLLSTIRAQP